MFLRCWEEVGQMPTYDKILDMLTNVKSPWENHRLVWRGGSLEKQLDLGAANPWTPGRLAHAGFPWNL